MTALSRRDLWLDRIIRVFCWVGLILVALAVMRQWKVPAYGDWKQEKFREPSTLALGGVGLSMIALFGLGWMFLHFRGRSPEPARRIRPIADLLPDDAELDPWIDPLSTMLLITDTNQYLARVNERIEVEDGYYRRSVISEWVLPRDRLYPTDEAAIYLLPVVRAQRAKTVDNLSFENASGTRISTCNTYEFQLIGRELLRSAIRTISSDEDWAQGFDAAITDVIAETSFDADPPAGDPGAARTGGEPDPIDVLVAKLRALDMPDTWDDHDEWDEMRNAIIKFAWSLTHSYVIFVPVSGVGGDRVTIKHSFTHRTRPLKFNLSDRIRFLFGLRPHDHQLPLYYHGYTRSYHLDFRPPDDQYVYAAEVQASGVYTARNVVSIPYNGAGARDYAHVWVRPYDPASPRQRANLVAWFDCREKPPGLLGVVTLVAAAQAVFIWIVGKFYPQFFPDIHHPTSGTDVPALLLALPGVGAAWLGAQFTTRRMRSTSLATVLGVFTSGLIAIVSTAAAVTRSAGQIVGEQFGIQHFAWVALMAFSALLAADLAVRSIMRGYRFSRCIKVVEKETTMLIP